MAITTKQFKTSQWNGFTPKFSNVHTQKWMTQGETRLNSNTVNNLMTMESDAIAARFLFAARSTTAQEGGGFDKVSISPTGSINDGYTPTNSAGSVDNTMWVPFTYDGGGTFETTDTIIRGGTRLNFNNARPLDTSINASFVESPVCSDWVPFKPLARTDSPAVNLPLAHIRGYGASLMPVYSNSGVVADWNTANMGRTLTSYFKSGDFVTTPSGFTAPTAADYVIGSGIQFLYKKRGLSILVVGDSTDVGDWQNNASGGQQGPMWLAAMGLSTPAFPITVTMLARSGSRQPSFSRQLRNYMDIVRPDIVVINGYSVNNPITTSTSVDDGINEAFADARYCLDKGAIPIIKIPSAWGYVSTSGAAWAAMIATLQASIPDFALVADHYAATVDPGDPTKPLAAYIASNSPYHLLRAGNQVIADTVYKPILQKIMSRRPQA